MHMRPYKLSDTSILAGAGAIFQIKHNRFYYGGTVTLDYVQGNSTAKKPQNDYECPHSSYYIKGDFIDGIGISIVPEIGFKINDSKQTEFFIFGGAGVSFGELIKTSVGESTPTGWTYDQGEIGKSSYFSFDASLRAVSRFSQVMDISFGYGLSRGFIIGVGWHI